MRAGLYWLMHGVCRTRLYICVVLGIFAKDCHLVFGSVCFASPSPWNFHFKSCEILPMNLLGFRFVEFSLLGRHV